MSVATKQPQKSSSKKRKISDNFSADLPEDLAQKVRRKISDRTETKTTIAIKALRLFFAQEEANTQN